MIRLVSFAALALYGAVRWATLLSPSPTWRLLGLFALAVLVGGAVPVLRRYGPAPGVVSDRCGLPDRPAPVAGCGGTRSCTCGSRSALALIGDGLVGLPNALVPYTGSSHDGADW